MNGHGFRSLSVTVLLLTVSIAILAVSAMGVQLPVRRELTIAIVDSRRSSPARESLELKVASLVRKAVSNAFRNEVRVQLVIANTADAKLKLNKRTYDAALVMGEDRPAGLRRLNLVTIAGTLVADSSYEPVSWLMPTGDADMNARLRDAFSHLIADGGSTAVSGRAPLDSLSSPGDKVVTVDR